MSKKYAVAPELSRSHTCANMSAAAAAPTAAEDDGSNSAPALRREETSGAPAAAGGSKWKLAQDKFMGRHSSEDRRIAQGFLSSTDEKRLLASSRAALSNRSGDLASSGGARKTLQTVVQHAMEAQRKDMSDDFIEDDDEEHSAAERCRKAVMLHPSAPVRRAWELGMHAVVIYLATAEPVRLAFTELQHTHFDGYDWVLSVLLGLDVLVNLRTAAVVERSLVVSPSRIAARYLCGWGALDLLIVLPWSLLTGVPALGPLLRCLKLLKVLSEGRLVAPTALQISAIRRGVQSYQMLLLRFGLRLWLFSHWFTCAWVALGLSQEGISWLRIMEREFAEGKVDLPQLDPPGLELYATAWYWALTTMSTIGYGDITPVNLSERLFACAVMLCGNVVFAYGVTTVVTAIANQDRVGRDFEQHLDSLNAYCAAMRIPEALRRELREFHLHRRDSSLAFSDEKQLLTALSPGLRAKVARLTNSVMIKAVPFFKHAGERFLDDILQVLTQSMYQPGEVILVEGDLGSAMYFVKQGLVELSLRTGKVLDVLRRGEHFGEVAILYAQRRGATARAVTYTLLFSLHQDDLRRILPKFPHVKQALIKEGERRLSCMRQQSQSYASSAREASSGGGGGTPGDSQSSTPRSTRPVGRVDPSAAGLGLGCGLASIPDDESQPQCALADDGGAGGSRDASLLGRRAADSREGVSRNEMDEFRDEVRGLIGTLQEGVQLLVERENAREQGSASFSRRPKRAMLRRAGTDELTRAPVSRRNDVSWMSALFGGGSSGSVPRGLQRRMTDGDLESAAEQTRRRAAQGAPPPEGAGSYHPGGYHEEEPPGGYHEEPPTTSHNGPRDPDVDAATEVRGRRSSDTTTDGSEGQWDVPSNGLESLDTLAGAMQSPSPQLESLRESPVSTTPRPS